MPASLKTYILDDLPTDTDALDFQPYVDTLVDIIQTGNTPLTIGVFGGWGSGKTSLMRMVKKGLPPEFTVAWFDAWKYDKEENLWRAFLLSILSALKDAAGKNNKPVEEFEKLESLLYREMELEKVGGVTIDLAKLGGKVAQGVVQIGLSFIPGISALTKLVEELQKSAATNAADEAVGAIQRERTKIHIEQVRFLEQFQEKFRILVEQHVTRQNGRLIVFVDDLDRCLPEKAIEVLEAIKLFVDAPGCIFVLGLDQEVIARGVEIRYKDFLKKDGTNQISGARYLEKIIQLPFQIPPVEQTDMGDFVHGLTPDWPNDECPRVFSLGLGDNPRQIKRTVNVFLMLWKLAEKREKKLQGLIKPIRLAKVVAIQTVYPELYAQLKETPRYLRDLEEYYRAVLTGERREPIRERLGLPESSTQVEPPPALASFVSRQAIRKILTMHLPDMHDANFFDLTPEELRLYFTLTRRAEIPQAAPIEPARQSFEPQMVRIPAGKFLMGSTAEQAAQAIKDGLDKDWANVEQPQHTVELSEYSISKYPLTNREYQAFVSEAKYKSPRGWDNDQYPAEKGDHPVVIISWEDATAYCKWLSDRTRKNYRLPTEAEWGKAARGTDGRIYPWGNEFDPKKCNMSESGNGDTSPVGQFSPQGDSPYGCADMAGNVWEWCNDWFDEKEYKNRKDGIKDPPGPQSGNRRVLRGGSFNSNRRLVRCAGRNWSVPDDFGRNLGFRVVVSPIFISET
jgi:formylglycine-generating enzyme required for sulfatase activity